MSQAGVSQPLSSKIAQRNAYRLEVPEVLNREARLYSLKELARRAGVSSDLFRKWNVEFGPTGTTVYVLPGTRKQIRFSDAPPELWSDLIQGTSCTARPGWMHEPADSLPKQLVVPFVHKSQIRPAPLFRLSGPDVLECTMDLAVSALLTLSRWEEELVTKRDRHGRVTASSCASHRDGYLMRPIVDECGLALQQGLEALMPNWKPTGRDLRVNISHDIDNIGLPFSFRTAVGHTIRRHKPSATLRDMLAWVPGLNPAYLQAVHDVVALSLDRGIGPAVYWKGTRSSAHYDPYHPKVKRMVTWLQQNKVELGVHPGYDTFRSPEKLRKEILTVREVLGVQPIGGRQDYLRWCPDTWLDWENCGLTYDSSVGFADHIGFRAGTCFPYRPWLFTLNREAHLTELPLIIMDITMPGYMDLTPEQSLEAINECVRQCRLVGGVFTLLWHNDGMCERSLGPLLPVVLDSLKSHRKFDFSNPSKDFY